MQPAPPKVVPTARYRSSNPSPSSLPGCWARHFSNAAAVQAVLESLGKRHGPEDARSEAQRFHDALQLGCELLIRAKMVPDRAGADTRAEVHILLSQLRQMPGASALEQAWLGARAGESGYLTGKDAQTAACDALTIPVVTGHADMQIIDQIIDLALTAYEHDQHGSGDSDALRYTIARLAVDFLSGPNGLASTLRTGLLQPRSARPACRSISATPTTSPPTSAAPSPCATGTAHGPAATDPPATATCTTSCTNKTAAQPASATASCSASSTTTSASTAGTGR